MSSTDGTAGTDGTNIQINTNQYFIRTIIQLDKMMPAPQLMLREQLVNMWFWKIKTYTFDIGPNSKISCLYVASFLGRRVSENLDCYPKMRTKNVFIEFFLRFHLKQYIFFSLFKSKNWRYTSKKCFYYFLEQKPFWPFLENKIKYLTNFNFKFYWWLLFYDILERILQIFNKDKYSFLTNNIQTLLRVRRTHGEIRRFFGIYHLKIYLISRNV